MKTPSEEKVQPTKLLFEDWFEELKLCGLWFEFGESLIRHSVRSLATET